MKRKKGSQPKKKPPKGKKKSPASFMQHDPTSIDYKEFVDEIVEGIVTFDVEGKVSFTNKAAAMMVGLSKDKVVGRHFTSFVDEHSVKDALAYFQTVLKGETVEQKTINIVTSSGTVYPVEFTASPKLKNGRVDQIHTIFRDVSERKEMETILRESEKMTAVQHYIMGTAQEIQGPLKGLSDKLGNLYKEYQGKDFEYIGYKEFVYIFNVIKNMREQADYCYDTTQRMLTLTQREIGLDEHHCRVNDVITDAVEKVSHSFETSDIKIELRLSKSLPQARIGGVELSQAINNVLTNAIQSIVHAGKITIKTRYDRKNKMILVDCIDNGVGIPKENLSKVFEPFYTTKQRGLEKSSGLGLSIVYSILKKYKGDINIKSSQRTGTVVRLMLPASKKTKKRKK